MACDFGPAYGEKPGLEQFSKCRGGVWIDCFRQSISAVASRQNIVHDVSVNIGQAEVTTLITIREASMINSQQMQNRGIQVMNMHGAWLPFVCSRLR